MVKKLLKRILPKRTGTYVFFSKLKLSSFLLKGTLYHCSVCSKSWRKMGDYGSRKNVLCPSCFSLERHRLLFSYLKKETNILTQEVSILHFAPERCLYKKISQNGLSKYITADLMNQHIAGLEIKPDIQMSVTDIKFDDNTFDYVICNHVLEHVLDDIKAIKEIYRVLKLDGVAILQVPINYESDVILEDYSLSPEERQKLYGYKEHIRYYAEKGYFERLSDCGFYVDLNDHVSTLDTRKNSLDPREKIFVCKKIA